MFDFGVKQSGRCNIRLLVTKCQFEEGDVETDDDKEDSLLERPKWGNKVESLMSFYASVGVGHVLRFPFVATQNGGSAFLIPYLSVLLLMGAPVFYLEYLIGQFCSRNPVKMWSLSPAMRGTGYGQALGSAYILSYYMVILALSVYYLCMSFQSDLPWGACAPEWEHCVDSDPSQRTKVVTGNASTSAKLYFVNTVLQQPHSIEGGLGEPIWYLSVCLLVAWTSIFLIVCKDISSSGKAAYFLTLFPYVVLISLLITTLTLPGSVGGIMYFLNPQWEKLKEFEIWYAAVTQVFFSLSLCTGAIIMFSSYNGFRQNVYRDSMIATFLDVIASIVSAVTIFSLLGNLAHVLDTEVKNVIGTGGIKLLFISYPDAIVKTFMPHGFAVLFYLFLMVLGLGSASALLAVISTIVQGCFPNVRPVYISALCCLFGFCIGLLYVTPGGQNLVELVDYYGGTFLALFCAIAEVIGVMWIYGLENFCLDIEYMLNRKTSMYWRFCWGIITPVTMILVFIYGLMSFDTILFKDSPAHPLLGYISGYTMLIIGVLPIPLFMGITFYKYWNGNFIETFKKAFHPQPSWGPRKPKDKRGWVLFKNNALMEQEKHRRSRLHHIWMSLTGGYGKDG